MAWQDGGNFAMGGFNMAQAMAAQQGGHLAGMINQTTEAIQRENESRVAQMREERRREHERQMKQMEIDAMLKRLEQEQRRGAGAQMGVTYTPGRGWSPM